MPVESAPSSAVREFVRRYNNTLCELQLQTGIHKRIENLMIAFSEEHPNLRASYISREVDESYFEDPMCPQEAMARPRLHGIVLDAENIYEFVSFANGFRRNVANLNTLLFMEEFWLETSPELPFLHKVVLTYKCGATTTLVATSGEVQDNVSEFVGRLKYLKGW